MKKSILYVTLAVSFIILVALSVASLGSTRVYVDPANIDDKKLKVGDTFTVNVNIADVLDLKGYEYRLKYDTRILNATSITSSTFLSSSPYCIIKKIDNAEGMIWISCMKSLSSGTGVDGSGTLETITFQVLSKGDSSLDLYRTVLGDHTGASIPHLVEDSSFINHPETSKR